MKIASGYDVYLMIMELVARYVDIGTYSLLLQEFLILFNQD